MKENALAVFEGKKIRKVWHDGEWYFSVVDVVGVLIEQSDYQRTRKYWNKLKQRLKEEGSEAVTNCHQLKLEAEDGKMRKTDCLNTKTLFRIIQSIPSKKAEPFKLWLAQVGYERIQEIENPELAQERMKRLYEQKGYSKEWIDKRLRGIAVRQELAEEWRQRGVNEGIEFGILTNEISKATFGKTVEEYKLFKGLKRHNLSDHMGDLELIFTMLGEASTTKIARSTDAQELEENRTAARKGGKIAGNAREELEFESKGKVVTPDNYLEVPEKVKRLKNK
ncbi:MAG: BRO family protein, partial [archaeon]|nr:BRO family protein [archaeon]